jgi:excisionase family DNA binding protein
MEEFLTVAQVAERLKLNQQTVRNWIDAGTLPAFASAAGSGSARQTSTDSWQRAIPAAAQATTSGGPAAGI